jgi:hypothetical protein
MQNVPLMTLELAAIDISNLGDVFGGAYNRLERALLFAGPSFSEQRLVDAYRRSPGEFQTPRSVEIGRGP